MSHPASKHIQGETRSSVTIWGRPIEIQVLHLGEGVEWYSLGDFCVIMGLKRTDGKPNLMGARNLLNKLGVPLVDWSNKKTYFLFAAFERACLLVSRYGGPGFIAPGTRNANRLGKARKDSRGRVREVTPEVIEKYGIGLEDELAILQGRRKAAIKKAVLARVNRVGHQVAEETKGGNESAGGG